MQSSIEPYLYISYCEEDRAVAEFIAQHLRDSGIKLWLDKSELRQEGIFDDWIKNALSQCTHFLPFYSSSYNSSKWVQAELLAIESRFNQSSPGSLEIIPVVLQRDNVKDLPVFLSKFHWLEFPGFNDYYVFFKRLLWSIDSRSSEPISDQAPDNKNVSNPEPNKKLRTITTIRLPDIDWVEIPAGSFIYGEDSSRQTFLTLKRFHISRYPITNCQYQTFIDDGGYSDKRWWQDLSKPEPEKSTWTQANRPRENINWFEALAFTRWLSHKLGYEITLPTEQQWEKAARGIDGREYPWGAGFKSGYANVDDPSAGEDNLQQTIAVGLFPQNQSPFQVMDMAGNVWEWCLNKLDWSEQTEPDQSNDERVLRGGSWNNSPGKARSDVRYKHGPINRQYGSLGFRVVC